MSGLLPVILGMLLNSVGLYVFSDAVIYRTHEPGAINAWLWDGILALILINLGIWLIAAGAKGRGRD